MWSGSASKHLFSMQPKRVMPPTGRESRCTCLDITDDYLEMMKNPPAGFGKNMNPCMDCHALMFRKAGGYMLEHGFDFLFSGEVVGQRPMSQNSNSLRYVAKHSGFGDRILRPLSALRLVETQMETNGLVDRARLLDWSGRSRKPQMALAEQLGITDYPSPAGGCLLTDPGFSKRLRDLLDHQPHPSRDSLHLLKYGRHMRLNPATKIIVGRTKQDNQNIMGHAASNKDLLLKVKSHPGPTVVAPADADKTALFLAAAICAGYSKASELATTVVQITGPGRSETLSVLPVLPNEAKRFLI